MQIIGTRKTDATKLVCLDADGLLHHSLIVGQSGSGKSFFVARLVEEIVLNTSARVVIVDPNGDFRSISLPSAPAFCAHSNGFAAVRGRRTPDFDDEATFATEWARRRFLSLQPNTTVLPEDRPMSLNRRLVVHWESLEEEDQDFLIGLGQPLKDKVQAGLEVCKQYAQYLSARQGSGLGTDLRELTRAADEFRVRNVSMFHYPHVKELTADDWFSVRSTIEDLLKRYTVWSSASVESMAPRLVGLTEFIDGPFQPVVASSELYWNVMTLALDAAREADSLLIVDTLLARLWRNAKAAWRRATNPTRTGEDLRVPTFVVIDEAQNFAPNGTTNPLRTRVTERLLQIAAEGRKYGIYLILATQRPTKLHPALVPECENSCVLRVQSSLDIKFAIDALGIEEKLARNCPTFMKGEGVVSGRWLDTEFGVDTQFVPARSLVGGGGLPGAWRTRTAPSVPFDVSDPLIPVRDVIYAELSDSNVPVTLVELAEVVRAECPGAGKVGWLGRGTFKALLLESKVPGLVISTSVPPGYAYLNGVHAPPPQPEPTNSDLPSDVRDALMELHRQKDTPLIGATTFSSILQTLSELVQESVYTMTELSKTVRNVMVERGGRAARSSINYVVRGISFGGHRFDPDLPQEAPILASAFVRSLLYDLELTVPLEGDALIRVLNHCAGGLLDQAAVRRLVDQREQGKIVPESRQEVGRGQDAGGSDQFGLDSESNGKSG